MVIDPLRAIQQRTPWMIPGTRSVPSRASLVLPAILASLFACLSPICPWSLPLLSTTSALTNRRTCLMYALALR